MENDFGDRLKSLRLSRGLTQSDVADVMNVNVVTVCHWEKSKQEPCLDDLKKLCDYFDITSNELLGF